MFLIDTNIISVTAPGRARHAQTVADWLDVNSTTIYLSVITIGEVEQGISRLRRNGAHQRAADLMEWQHSVISIYGDRVLPIDIAGALRLGRLSDHARGAGLAAEYPDLIIAATASVHGLTVLTRNIRHFDGLGISVHNPYDTLPGDTP